MIMGTSLWMITLTCVTLVLPFYCKELELYDNSDIGLTILKVENFNSTIYNLNPGGTATSGNFIWFIQFYNTWCGHCQHFAPSWKSLSNVTMAWDKSLRLAVVDCSKTENSPICNQYGVSSYPSMKFFPPKCQSETNVTTYAGPHTEKGVFSGLLDYMEKIKFPLDMVIIAEKSMEELWTALPSDVSDVILLIEGSDSKLGQEVLLSVIGHITASGLTVRRVTVLNAAFLESLREDPLMTSVRLWSINRNGKKTKIEVPGSVSNSALDYIEAIFTFDDQLAVAKGQQKSERERRPHLKPSDATGHAVKTEKPHAAKSNDVIVYTSDMTDLISSLVYMFPMEIGTHAEIKGEELIALQKLIPALAELIPYPQNVLTPLQKLSDVLRKETNSITSVRILTILKDNGLDTEVQPTTWVGCRGSVPGRRGYPCSVWQLFHTLTIFAMEMDLHPHGNHSVSKNALDPNSGILTAIFSYVQHFFSCQECRENFILTANALTSQTSTFTNRDAVLWLWRTHNAVNERLAGDITEDEGFPKIQFPSPAQCSTCRHRKDGQWWDDEIVHFLRSYYGLKKVTFNVRDSKHRQMAAMRDFDQLQVTSGAAHVEPAWSSGLWFFGVVGFLLGILAGYRQLVRWRRHPVRWNFAYNKARVKWM